MNVSLNVIFIIIYRTDKQYFSRAPKLWFRSDRQVLFTSEQPKRQNRALTI